MAAGGFPLLAKLPWTPLRTVAQDAGFLKYQCMGVSKLACCMGFSLVLVMFGMLQWWSEFQHYVDFSWGTAAWGTAARTSIPDNMLIHQGVTFEHCIACQRCRSTVDV